MPDNPGLIGRATPSTRARIHTKMTKRTDAALIFDPPANLARPKLHGPTRVDDVPELDATTGNFIGTDC